jgi:nitrite reductase/ring-hydroxylating ferredoxin subunit/uncharacterized membrane protein
MGLSQKLTEAALAIPGLDGAADLLAGIANGAYAKLGASGRTVRDALNGTWLGHPLHPAVTDVPVGAWTVMLLLDAANQRQTARQALGIGLAGAALAAASGLTDWLDTSGRARRLGVVHATLNIGATLLCGVSFALRPRAYRAAVWMSTIGYAIAGCSAIYGGVLSLDLQIGVNRAHASDPPEDEIDAGELAQIPNPGMQRVDAGGYAVLVVRDGERVAAISAACAHQSGPLDEGTLDLAARAVTCPWHGSCFRIDDGEIVHGPSAFPQPAFRVRIANDHVYLSRLSGAT